MVGRGASAAARLARWRRRRSLRAGWSNHVRTRRCQSYYKAMLAFGVERNKLTMASGRYFSEVVVGQLLVPVQGHDSPRTEQLAL